MALIKRVVIKKKKVCHKCKKELEVGSVAVKDRRQKYQATSSEKDKNGKIICPNCKINYVDEGYTLCNKCGTLTGHLWSDAVLIIGVSLILTMITIFTVIGILNQWFILIPCGIFVALALFSFIYYGTPLGKIIYNKKPKIFVNPVEDK